MRPFLLESGEIQTVVMAEDEEAAVHKLFNEIDREARQVKLGRIIQCTSEAGIVYKTTNAVLRRRAADGGTSEAVPNRKG